MSGLRCRCSSLGPGPRPGPHGSVFPREPGCGGAWALPRPGEADPRLHGVRRRLHSPGSLPGVALGRLSSPRAARSHLVEPPEETLVLLFGLSLKAACVKKSACVVCSAPRVFADGPQPCNPGWEPKRDQRQGPRSLPSGHCPSPPSTTGPDGDFPGPGARGPQLLRVVCPCRRPAVASRPVVCRRS